MRRLFDRIRQLRTQRGLTQEEFAEDAHLSYKYYQAVEAGRKADLRLSTLERLAKAHGMEVWELLMPQPPVVAESQSRYGKALRRKRSKKSRT